jgi:MFS family permease
VLTLARFSEAFLILKADGAGHSLAFIPLVLIVMNIVHAASAYPMGILSDRVNRHVILVAGFLVLIAADLVLAVAPNLGFVMLGIGLWGLHMGMTQGLLAALVAEATAPAFRGTAFGVFHLITGLRRFWPASSRVSYGRRWVPRPHSSGEPPSLRSVFWACFCSCVPAVLSPRFETVRLVKI